MAYDNLTLRKHFLRYDGGLSTRDEPNKIDDHQSPDLQNVRPIGFGAYAPRNGIRRIGDDRSSTAGSASSVYNFARASVEQLISAYNTTLEYLNSSDTWTAVPGIPTYTADQLFGFAHNVSYVFGCNAVEDFFIWDGNDKESTAFTVTAANDTIDAVAHGMLAGQLVKFSSDNTLPAGLSSSVVYFVINVTTDTFKVSTTAGGSAVDITDTGTGSHTFQSSIKTYSSNPKGNIMTFFLNKLWVAGVSTTPAILHYSVTDDPVDFASAGSGTFEFGDGGDSITALKTLTSISDFGGGEQRLLVFKKSSRVYMIFLDSSGNLQSQEVKRDTGAINNNSTIIIGNDVFYIDEGNNISNLGYEENIQNEIRTNTTTDALSRTIEAINLDDSCAIYWKKRRMAFYAGKNYGSSFNDSVLVYFKDFQSWYRWRGINANQFALYEGEIVWASSVDRNVYKYDETVFDDDYSESGEAGAGAINSYYSTKDEEFIDREAVGLFANYKQLRFVPIRGYISPGATMVIKIYGDDDLISTQSFSGTDSNITKENINVYFGSTVFGRRAFGGSDLSASAFPMREFFAIVSLDGYSALRFRVLIEVEGAGMPYLITLISMWAEIMAEEKWPAEIKI